MGRRWGSVGAALLIACGGVALLTAGTRTGRYLVRAAWEEGKILRGRRSISALVRDPATKEPAPELVAAIVDAAFQRGLILLKAGVHGNCIRVLCPLTIEDAVLDEALEVWESAVVDCLPGRVLARPVG